MPHPLLDASCRIALGAYLHDRGKFAERARIFHDDPRLEVHLQLYCPFHAEGGWFSHQHAAHTALAFTSIEDRLPDTLAGDVFPFTGRVRAGDEGAGEPTDSLVNAAAAHHKPSTFLQWIIATADRIASGFEREEFEEYNRAPEKRASGLNHYTSRQLTLFEQMRGDAAEPSESSLKWRYPLRMLAPRTLFPAPAAECERRDDRPAQAEYRALWERFATALEEIPKSHRANLALWLDHFDSLWLACTHAIPAATAFGVRPEVSLYDHSRATAALAVALWRWHEANDRTDAAAIEGLKTRSDFNESKFLLIQGDFFGIQDFIFATGGESRKHAAKLLRGRSFQVSLFTELAALRVLEELGLPATSQVINAAGKFLIVAPNTDDVRRRLDEIRQQLDVWFLANTFGQAGIGLAWSPASCSDFLRRGGEKNESAPFSKLMTRLHQQLDRAKHQRFGLCASGGKVFEQVDFGLGPCAYNGRLPGDRNDAGVISCALSRDQIAIGESLVRFGRLLVLSEDARGLLYKGGNLRPLEVELFGYVVAFTAPEEASGRFGELAYGGQLRRCWDFSLPAATDRDGIAPLWAGFARRFISGFVPRVHPDDAGPFRDRYAGLADEELPAVGELKTLDMLACENRRPSEHSPDQWEGIAALGVLKGDIDNLGELFRAGLRQPTVAKMAALSRQVNGFFAIYLPWLLARDFPGIYTVFAGGDDFFLIGPWRNVQQLAARLRTEFQAYVAHNERIHFSVGIATQKPGAPIHTVAELAENALTAAKAHPGKDAVTCFGETIPWSRWAELETAGVRLAELRREAKLSTAFVYGLLRFVDMRQEESRGFAEAAIWRSRLAYRTRRFVVDKQRRLDEEGKRRQTTRIVQDIGAAGVDALGSAYRIVLFNHLYQFRDR
jgi:CRISPR-associated protein Csm1